MVTLSFSGRCVQDVIVFCYSDSFNQKKTQQSDGSCNVTSDSQLLNKLFKKQSFFSGNTYEKHIVSKVYCIACCDDKICFLPNVTCHIILLGDIKELLQKLVEFCFNYQHVDCLSDFFKYGLRGKTSS